MNRFDLPTYKKINSYHNEKPNQFLPLAAYTEFSQNPQNKGKIVTETSRDSTTGKFCIIGHSLSDLHSEASESNNRAVIDNFKKSLRNHYEDEAIVNYFTKEHEEQAMTHGLDSAIIQQVVRKGIQLYERSSIGTYRLRVEQTDKPSILPEGALRNIHEQIMNKAQAEQERKIKISQEIDAFFNTLGSRDETRETVSLFNEAYAREAFNSGLTEAMKTSLRNYQNSLFA